MKLRLKKLYTVRSFILASDLYKVFIFSIINFAINDSDIFSMNKVVLSTLLYILLLSSPTLDCFFWFCSNSMLIILMCCLIDDKNKKMKINLCPCLSIVALKKTI